MGVADRLEDVTATLVLGGGFVAMALGYDWFWLVWVLGFVTVVPLVDLVVEPAVKRLVERDDPDADDADDTQDALDALRERYARGDLSDAEFERKVERLVATESVEDAEATVATDAESAADRERDAERA